MEEIIERLEKIQDDYYNKAWNETDKEKANNWLDKMIAVGDAINILKGVED